MINRDYISIAKLENNFNFSDIGWADGYADLKSDHDNLINELYGKISQSELILCLDSYLQGYELGKFMSENAAEIYDEDGNLKNEYSLDTISHYDIAESLIKQKVNELNSKIYR